MREKRQPELDLGGNNCPFQTTRTTHTLGPGPSGFQSKVGSGGQGERPRRLARSRLRLVDTMGTRPPNLLATPSCQLHPQHEHPLRWICSTTSQPQASREMSRRREGEREPAYNHFSSNGSVRLESLDTYRQRPATASASLKISVRFAPPWPPYKQPCIACLENGRAERASACGLKPSQGPGPGDR